MNGKALQERLWHLVPGPAQPPLRLLVRAGTLWVAQGGPQYGAAIAFYTMFALAPLLVLAIWLSGMVFGAEAARGQIVGQIESLVGSMAAQGIESLIESAWREPVGNLAGVLAIATLLLGASGVFTQLRLALNAMGEIRAEASPVSTFVRARLVAFALVLGFGFLAIVSLLASAAVAALGAWLSARLPGVAALLALGDVAVSTAVIAIGFAALLRWLPDRATSRHAIWVGAFAGALLFSLGKHLIGLYLGRASVASSYGAAGSFVVVMMWMYYSAQILLFGASLGRAIDERQGLAPGNNAVSEPAPALQPAAAARSSLRAPFDGRRDPGPDDEHGAPRGASPNSAGPGSGAKVLPFNAAAARSRRGMR